MNRVQKLAAIPLATAILLGAGAAAGYATLAAAQTTTTGQTNTQASSTPWAHHMGMGFRGHDMHGVMGTVSAVNGSTITVTGKNGQTYTINAGSAPVDRFVQGSVSDIKVGDRIGVQGSVSGNTVTAGHIIDGLPTPPQGAQQ